MIFLEVIDAKMRLVHLHAKRRYYDFLIKYIDKEIIRTKKGYV